MRAAPKRPICNPPDGGDRAAVLAAAACFIEEQPMADGNPSQTRERATRLFKKPIDAWEERTQMVKREAEAERVAVDKKTARLKALRLEKEAAEREAALLAPPVAKPRPRKIVKA
jgi:hypothetical protein